jgi:hypothetical protein
MFRELKIVHDEMDKKVQQEREEMDQKEQRKRESGQPICLVTFNSAWHVIQNRENVVLDKLAY